MTHAVTQPTPATLVGEGLAPARAPTAGDPPHAHIDHPSGFFAFADKNQHFTAPDLPGFVAYREHGKHLVMFGGVHAPEPARRALLQAFCDHAAARKRRPLAVQVRADQAPLFAEFGFTTNRLGASYALAIADHGLSGSKRVKMRQKVRRAQKLGLQVVELGVEVPRDEAAFARLRELSAAWLKEKGKPELEFMIGWLGEPEEERRRVFVVVDPGGNGVGGCRKTRPATEHLRMDTGTRALVHASPAEADDQEAGSNQHRGPSQGASPSDSVGGGCRKHAQAGGESQRSQPAGADNRMSPGASVVPSPEHQPDPARVRRTPVSAGNAGPRAQSRSAPRRAKPGGLWGAEPPANHTLRSAPAPPPPRSTATASSQCDSLGGAAPREPHTDRWVGFISYVPAWGARPGWLHDLTRRVSDAPPGTMELCNHLAIERFREEGAEWLHLGFTPFIPGPEPELPEASRFASWVIGKLASHGKVVYPAQDQVRYKRKWAPSVIESEYVAFRPLSLRAIWDLLRLTRSI